MPHIEDMGSKTLGIRFSHMRILSSSMVPSGGLEITCTSSHKSEPFSCYFVCLLIMWTSPAIHYFSYLDFCLLFYFCYFYFFFIINKIFIMLFLFFSFFLLITLFILVP